MRFSYFCSHVSNTHIFEHPFSVQFSDGPETFQLELTELQYDSTLHSNFNQKALITIYFMLLFQYLSSELH